MATLNPLTRDRLRYRSGRALDRTASTNRQLARALDVGESDTSRWRNGSAGRHGPHATFYEHVYRLQIHDKTSPYPLIADVLAMAAEALCEVPDERLVSRFWRLVALEAEREGVENQRTATYARHGCLDSIADAMQDEAAVGIELAAHCRELRKRDIDPRAAKWAKDGAA